jgi:hypothetical protein
MMHGYVQRHIVLLWHALTMIAFGTHQQAIISMLNHVSYFSDAELKLVVNLLECVDKCFDCEADAGSRRQCDKALGQLQTIQSQIKDTESEASGSSTPDGVVRTSSTNSTRKRPTKLSYWAGRLYKLISQRKLVLRNIQASTDHFAYHKPSRVCRVSTACTKLRLICNVSGGTRLSMFHD